jgi:hypothetical protein
MAIRKFSWRRQFIFYLGLGITVLWGIYAMARPVDEVVLSIGESYEQVRRQSRSTLPAIEPNANWGGSVSRPTRLRFVDPPIWFCHACGEVPGGKVRQQRQCRFRFAISPSGDTTP